MRLLHTSIEAVLHPSSPFWNFPLLRVVPYRHDSYLIQHLFLTYNQALDFKKALCHERRSWIDCCLMCFHFVNLVLLHRCPIVAAPELHWWCEASFEMPQPYCIDAALLFSLFLCLKTHSALNVPAIFSLYYGGTCEVPLNLRFSALFLPKTLHLASILPYAIFGLLI